MNNNVLKTQVTKNIILCKSQPILCSRTKQLMATKAYSYAAAVMKSEKNEFAMKSEKNEFAIADSGTTGHFLQMDSICEDKKRTSDGICVQLPDGSSI